MSTTPSHIQSDTSITHVTNGDTTAERLREGGVVGPIVVWRDVLHFGPIPAGLPLAALSELRAEHLSARFQLPIESVRLQFEERDAHFRAVRGPMLLWFEHDLYDQLQLLQILSELHRSATPLSGNGEPVAGKPVTVELVTTDRHEDVDDFRGLGQLGGSALTALVDSSAAVGPAESSLADRVWNELRAADPAGLLTVREGLEDAVGAPLRFLPAALDRWFEDFPWLSDGLSRTQRAVLTGCSRGLGADPVELFEHCQAAEEAPFLGDVLFAVEALEMASEPAALITPEESTPEAPATPPVTFFEHRWKLTDLGQRVLNGANWLEHRRAPGFQGGVELASCRWRFDPDSRRLSLGEG